MEDQTGRNDSEEASKELAKIDKKLTGVMEGHGAAPLSVQAQVQRQKTMTIQRPDSVEMLLLMTFFVIAY